MLANLNIDIKDRLLRLLIFIITCFLIIRFIIVPSAYTDITDIDQAKIITAATICFMFVNTYYPVVVLKE